MKPYIKWAAANLFLFSMGFGNSVSADYFVSNSGNDANDGRSHATAWATIDKVNAATLSTGSDVYFETGGVWHDQQLWIDWSGTATDPVRIGCYKLVGGKETDCAAGDLRPEINGTLDAACLADLTCTINGQNHDGSPGTTSVPPIRWQGLIEIKADYVHISYLKLLDSAGSAISTENNKNRKGYVFEDLEVTRTANRLISFGRRTTDMVVRNSSFSKYNYCDYGSGNYNPWNVCSAKAWPGGIFIWDSRNANALIENNTVTEGYGEGINCLQSSHVIIRGNRVGNLRSTRIYLDNCSNTIVENNIVWGDPGLDWHFTPLGGEGISVFIENYQYMYNSLNNVVRNNIMTGLGKCLQVGLHHDVGDEWKVGAEVYGNTCLHPTHTGFDFGGAAGRGFETLIVKNNIIYAPHAERQECSMSSWADDVIEVSNNLFSGSSKVDQGCIGQDSVFSDPMIDISASEAAAFDHELMPIVSDFKLSTGSPAIDAGLQLGDLRTSITYSNNELLQSGCSEDTTAALSYDINCNLRGNPPVLGALELTSSTPKPPRILF